MRKDFRPPERTCILTRATADAAEMLSFVLGPDGTVVFDVARKLPGRGAWLANDRATVERAARKNPFRRAFGAEATVAPDLADVVENALRSHALSTLAMANKAGLVLSGFDKVRVGLKGGRVAVLAGGSDASDDGRSRLSRLASHSGGAHNGVLVVDVFSVGDLSQALGKERAVHVALAAHPLSASFAARAERLRLYRGAATPDVGGVEDPGERRDRPGSGPRSGEASTDRPGPPATRNEERQTAAFAGTRAV